VRRCPGRKLVIDTTNQFGRTARGFGVLDLGASSAAARNAAKAPPKGDLYGEEFHHEDAVAAVARLRGMPPSGRGRP
jgi:hypothetical protein